MYSLILKERAIRMAQEAFHWYNDRQTGLGEEFLLELESDLRKIETHPKLFTVVKQRFRQYVMRRFPYVIVYEVIKDEVIVYAVFHTKQNPKRKFQK